MWYVSDSENTDTEHWFLYELQYPLAKMIHQKNLFDPRNFKKSQTCVTKREKERGGLNSKLVSKTNKRQNFRKELQFNY